MESKRTWEFVADKKIRIVLADDHTVMRAGTRRILEDEDDFVVVGEAGDGLEALALAEIATPDVIVLDIGMPHLDGIKTCQQIRSRWPQLHILILTGHDNAALVRSLHQLGVEGYLLKSASAHELVEAIRAIAYGKEAYGEDAVRALAAQNAAVDLQLPTRKELEVIHAVARGLKNREIADELNMSVNTVEYHLRHIFAKLSANTRADALMKAQSLGWLDN